MLTSTAWLTARMCPVLLCEGFGRTVLLDCSSKHALPFARQLRVPEAASGAWQSDGARPCAAEDEDLLFKMASSLARECSRTLGLDSSDPVPAACGTLGPCLLA